MDDDGGALFVYMAGIAAGAALGAACGAVLALDGATWHRVWQLAACGAYVGLFVMAFLLATRGVSDDDADRRSDVCPLGDGGPETRG